MTGSRRPKLSDVLYNDMLAQIRQGRFQLDERLPSEHELSQTFDVSRPIVREALGRLRDDGLIYSRRGAGSFVSQVPAQDYSQPEAEPLPPLQSIEDVRKFYEFRLAIEGEGAFWAASNRTEAALAEIKSELAELELAVRTGQIGVNQDFDFHMAIARASGNQFFESSLGILRPHLNFLIDLARSFSISVSNEHLLMVQAEHADVAAAIERADPPGARDAMRRHIERAQRRVFIGNPQQPLRSA